MTDQQKALLAIFLCALIAGAIAPITKIGLTSISPIMFVWTRFAIASIVVIPFLISRKTIFLKTFFSLTPLSLLTTINVVFFIYGVKLTTATIGQLLYAASPMFITLFLFFVHKQKHSLQKVVGIVIGFLGTVLVILLPLIEKNIAFSGDFFGNLLIAVGVISWSFYLIFSKTKLTTVSPFLLSIHAIVTTTIVLTPFAVYEFLHNSASFFSMSLVGWTTIAYVAIPGTILAYIFNQYAIKHGGSIIASMNLYLLPILAYIFSNLLLGEQLTTGIIIGGLLVIAGVYLVTKR